MADILPFPTELPCSGHQDDPHDRFLIDEGLEFLADFRSIEDREVRTSLRTLVKLMAVSQRKSAEQNPPEP